MTEEKDKKQVATPLSREGFARLHSRVMAQQQEAEEESKRLNVKLPLRKFVSSEEERSL